MEQDKKRMIFGLIPILFIMGGAIWVFWFGSFDSDFLIAFTIVGYIIISICFLLTIASLSDVI